MKSNRPKLLRSNRLALRITICLAVLLLPQMTQAQAPSWQELLTSSDPEVRIRGVVAAAKSPLPDALRAVGREINDANPFVRSAAREAIRSNGKLGIEWLLGNVDPVTISEKTRNANHLLEYLSGMIGGNFTEQLDPDTTRRVLTETIALRCREGICLEKWMKPEYPPLAYSAAVTGQVWVTFNVADKGKPIEISAAGPPLIVKAAIDAIEKWEFTRTSNPSSSKQIVLVEFQLSEPSSFSREVVSEMIFPNHVLVSAKRLR